MSKNAAGQLLGYAIQIPRALYHLLTATEGCAVCIEVHGDVATVMPDRTTMIAEEDKSSIASNPVADKSTDLWKTLSNWVDGVEKGEFNVSSTTFVLYRNQSGRAGLVDIFDKCSTREEAEQALAKASTKLSYIDGQHPIWPHYKHALLDNRDTLIDVIVNFQLETGDGSGYEAVERALREKLVPNRQIEFVTRHLSGWLLKLVMDRIAQRHQAIIKFEEFAHECAVLFERARCVELLDFTIQPSNDEVDIHVRSRPTYLRQIEFINGENDELIEAVTDFLKAKTNREKWIENEVIDESIATEFETNLRQFWQNKNKQFDLCHKNSMSKEERGQLLLAECKNRVETIRNERPPPSTIAGTYHALANQPVLGWHDDWEAEFKK